MKQKCNSLEEGKTPGERENSTENLGEMKRLLIEYLPKKGYIPKKRYILYTYIIYNI